MNRKRTRRLARYQYEQHREEMTRLLTEIAVLEGRVMAAYKLNEHELQEQIYGGYLSPWERCFPHAGGGEPLRRCRRHS